MEFEGFGSEIFLDVFGLVDSFEVAYEIRFVGLICEVLSAHVQGPLRDVILL